MSDYIKREDALSTFSNAFYAGLAAKINAIPSEDVAPIVRCEDCKFSELFQNDSSGVMARYCKAFTFERMVADNDFCSYGERKDDE